MEITYKITEIGVNTLEKFTWLRSNYTLGELGTRDNREITRLLENPHDHIKILEQIDKYGSISEEIGETILTCNDYMVFLRLLKELTLFIHLYEKLGSKVIPIRRIKNQKTPDLLVRINDLEALIEIYSPMDYYGYQIFSRSLTRCVKNLPIDIGFIISIDSESKNRVYTFDFPEFREVYDWFDQFKEKLIKWLNIAKIGDSLEVDSPAVSAKLKIYLISIEDDSGIRRIKWGEAARSTDTRHYFEINDPTKFAKTEWGIKIKEKLKIQQAGEPREKVIRILAINFTFADTLDICFFNESKYYSNLKEDIKYLASNIKPYPPYDIVLPCKLGFECGFVKPINLSKLSNSFIKKLLSTIYLDTPIKEIPVVSEEEARAIWNSIINYYNNEPGFK